MTDAAEPRGMNKAERLELAAAVAPSLRSASAKTLARKVTLYDPETGEVTGYTTGAEALKGLARIQELEHAVEEGVRPKAVVCKNCGRVIVVGHGGGIPSVCPLGCSRKCETAGCTGQLSVLTAKEKAKFRDAVLCSRCSRRAAAMAFHARQSPEEKAERRERIRAAKNTDEARTLAGVKARASASALTREQRAERARRSSASMTPEQRSERARKSNSSMTSEQRSARARKANAGRWVATTCHPDRPNRAGGLCSTCYQRSQRAKKANEQRTEEAET